MSVMNIIISAAMPVNAEKQARMLPSGTCRFGFLYRQSQDESEKRRFVF